MDNEYEQTRKRLGDGTLLQTFRANPPPGVRLRTDAELEETLSEALRHHDPTEDLHVFGYGSLMWNPAMDVVQTRVARVQGWHRRFCFRKALPRSRARRWRWTMAPLEPTSTPRSGASRDSASMTRVSSVCDAQYFGPTRSWQGLSIRRVAGIRCARRPQRPSR